MRRYRLPYWVFMPTLGVWPGPTGTKAAAVNDTVVPLPGSNTVDVNINNGEVTVADASRRRPPDLVQTHPNTPSVGGPSSLRKSAAPAVRTVAKEDPTASVVAGKPETKVYLKPVARAKAGAGGLALSNPISTAVVRRGDTVSIEYVPEAIADVGDGGVAISRPELIIHFID